MYIYVISMSRYSYMYKSIKSIHDKLDNPQKVDNVIITSVYVGTVIHGVTPLVPYHRDTITTA